MLDWYSREDLPWRALNDIEEVMRDNPTLVCGECLVYVCTLLAIWHAKTCGRQHVLLLLASVITGTANDIFFMYMPFVDNFFHAQFTFMLTPRLPLYIPCVYVCFTYISAAAALRFGLTSPVSQSAACGLAGALYYSVYDLLGQKFLWWTWHDTDAAIAVRWLGVPFGSTLWTFVHCFCFTYLLHYMALRHEKLSLLRFSCSLVGSALLTTPFMMLSMSPFQMHQMGVRLSPEFEVYQLPGRPDALALALALGTGLVLVCFGWTSRRIVPSPFPWLDLERTRSADQVLLCAAVLHFSTFAGIMVMCDPSTIVATGVHQEYGPCDVKMKDLMGYERDEYLCKERYDEDFHFDCVEQPIPPVHSEWFTICGNAHSNYSLVAGTECALASWGIVLYTLALRLRGGNIGKAKRA